ncbi:GATOR1 complex protein NPRL3-like isoform X1 [Amphiura filiformis]|uniref:GATOR1 complex protein NPRL3-like isoform X1 n=1 Tax=Amphiura filiformis TaxID=82378 RepID=UPI003B216D54
MIMFNLVFVLHASADNSLVQCYQDLSKRLALALKHEQRRCGYLSHQAITMVSVYDEVMALPEDIGDSPFQLMLSRSKLCRDLKDVYDGLCEYGVAHVHINNWIEVSFCLPHKVHNLDLLSIDPDTMEKSLAAIRPYHAMLLLADEKALLNDLPKDCSPSLRRIIKLSTPLKSLQQLSQDADLALSQVFQLVGHMVYWGKATIIYPICGSNVYVLSPHTPTDRFSPLHHEFHEKFNEELTKVLADFSLPTPLSEHTELSMSEADKFKMVVWLLQKRLLVQLHMYVFLITTNISPSQAASPGETKESKKAPLTLTVVDSPTDGAVNSHGSSGSILDNTSFDSDDHSMSTSLDSYSTMSMDDGPARGHSRQKILESLGNHLSSSEKASVMVVPAAANLADLKLFARLCPYFRGKNHLEEIMYFENVNRSQIRTLLDKFKQVLVACQHQDAATIRYKEFL